VVVRSGIGIALVPASAATLHRDGGVLRSIGDSSSPALLRL
jgi:hypothetical protein